MSAEPPGARFFDSNVFLYLFDSTDGRKRGIAQALVEGALRDGGVHISHQVVQETLNVATRKLTRALTADEAERFMAHSLLPLWHVMPSPALYMRAIRLQARWQLSFYDCLIVAAALEAGCTRLLTEDMQDGQRIDGLQIQNPFKT